MSFASGAGAVNHPPMTFDASLALVHSATRRAREYWEGRRKGHAMPARSDLEHAGMRSFIAHVGLIDCERQDPQIRYRIRLAGSAWEAVFGPMTRRTLSEFLSRDIEERWNAVFDKVCLERKPLRVSTRLGFRGKSWLDAEIFVAPLGEDRDTPSMLFLCFAVTDVALPIPQFAPGS